MKCSKKTINPKQAIIGREGKRMKKKIRERRSYMINEYNQSLSEKQAIEATARKFGIKKETLYIDWSRRGSWLKEIMDTKDHLIKIQQWEEEIQKSLKEIEKLAANADNDNCRVGAHTLKINILFKLIDLHSSLDREKLLDRIEKLEEIVSKNRGKDFEQ